MEGLSSGTAIERQPKVGVVIGSGGIKAFAAVPLFEFLSNTQIETNLLVGCSGGAITAALRGAGYDSDQMKELISELLDRRLFKRIDYRSIMGITRLPFGRFDKTSGILKPDAIKKVYQRVFGDLRLEDLQPTTVLQATDYQTGEGVILSTGLVADAVYASSAMFPVLPPIYIDGRWLIDGGFSSPVPVFEAVRRQIDVIIVVILQEKIAADPKGFVEAFWNLPKIFATSIHRSQIPLSIDLHHHEIVILNVVFDKYIQIWDVEEVPTILSAGRKAVDAKSESILSAIKSCYS